MKVSKKYDSHTTIADGVVGRMIAISALPIAVQAALVVTLVLVEAIVLYVGYGLIEERIAPPILEVIESV